MMSIEIEVGQDISAIDQKRISAQPRLGVFNPTAGFEQDRLVNKPDQATSA